MRKSLKYSLLSVALILCVVLGVKGYILQVASGTWAAQAGLTQTRSGASAVLLQDGRILVTGGDGAAGILASAEIIGADGTSSAVASMSTTRSKHVSAVLANGSVLVAGGTSSGGGAINTAEIYDPVANSWTTLSGVMIEARSNAAATVLLDGRVLIAGGDKSGVASSTIEIFDPAALTFSFAGALASPRTEHSLAQLSDGRVFIAGGSNGSTALNTTDIYDLVTGSVSAGPALSTRRMGHTAITMLDGRVLIAGGNNGTVDLASAEIFDPVAGTISAVTSSLSTARQGHLAFLLPNNNTVLIAGGTSTGVPLASAEVFTPWLGTFAPTGSMTVARTNPVGSPMKQDGLLVAAGGQDASGVAVANIDLYGFATVKTDAADYPPGTTVNITGSGWQPGETVALTLVESPLFDTHGPYTVVADANGRISDSSFVTDSHDLNILFYLTASGSVSQAQTIFKDSKPNTVTVGAQTPNPVAPGGSAQYTVIVNFNGNGSSCTSPLSIQNPAVLPTGATPTFNPASLTSTGGDVTSTLTITTTNSTPPTATPISFTVLAANGGGTCQAGTATGIATFAVVESTTTTLTSAVNPSTFGQSTTLTATVSKTSGPTTPNAGTVTFKDGVATLGTGTLNTSGVATLAVSNLTAGSHSLTASYAGTAIFGASTSSAVSQTVNQASTTTTLTSGTNPSSSGQSVTFTVTVAAVSPGAGIATGTVTFKDGTSAIGTGTLSAGTATLTTNTLTVGSHSITAVYAGDTNFTGSTSSALNQTVNQGGTTATITAHTPSPSVVGQAVNITFTVTSTGGTPTGNVTVSDGVAGDSCTATVAVGNCSITFPASGTKTLSAVYAGDTNFTGSTSANVSHVVNAAATTTAITAHTPNPSVVGQPITVNYSVTVSSPGSGTIPGTDNVTVSDGTVTCTGTVSAGTCQLTPTTTGNRTLSAIFAGDTNFSTSTSTGVSHTVNQAPTITSASSTTFAVGTAGSFTVTATGFPTPTFTESGNLPSGVTLSTAGVLSGTPAANTGGTYPITITANNGVSPNGTQSFVLTVNQAPVITSANATSFVANAPGTFTFTATGFPTAMTFTATGTLPSGVTLSSAGVLSGTTSVAGNFPLTVTASNGITPNATQSFTLTVGQAPAFTSANNAAFSVLTAGSFTVAASGFPSPTFTTASALPSGVTLTSAGVLSGTPASGTAGSYPLVITAHNGVGTDATQNFTLTVNKLTPTFSPALSSPAPIAFGTATVSLPPVSVMVTTGSIRASSPDTVTISINGTSSGPISFNGSSGTFGPFAFNTQTIPVGSYPIAYTYSGGSTFNGISDSGTTLTVNKANQTITVTTPAPATAAFNSSFTVAATASSGLPVTFSSSGACTNVNATFTMNSGTGTCTVKFDQAGNSNYSAAPEITETVSAQQSTATVTLSNLTQTYTGTPLTPSATTNPSGLSIAWTGAPDTNVGSYAVTAKVNDPNYQGSASGTFTITGVATTTSISAPPVTYPANGIVTVTVSSGAGTPTGNATLVVDGGLPLSAALNSGTATFTIANPSPGTHGLSASYAAQGNFAASGPATASLAVSQAPVITSAATTTFTAGVAGSFTITTMGVPFPSLGESGVLPSGVTFTDNGNGTATLAGTTIAAGTYPITITAANGVGLPATQTFTLTVTAGAFTKLQVLVPGETAAPGTTNGKTGTPSIEYVNGAFNVTVNAVDDNWNVVSTVTDTVQITSSDALAVLPADAALVAGTATFSVKLATPENPAATTVTASDTTDSTKAASTSAAMEVVVAYTASISPTTAANAVDTAYTLTVKNGDTPNANNLKSVTVAIPANGGVPTGVSVAATSSAAATPVNWMAETNPQAGFLRFRECVSGDSCYASGDNNDVTPGGSITIQFTTKAGETINNAAVNEVWTTTAFSDTAYTTALPLAGAEPTVAIATAAAITSANSTTFTNGTAATFTVTTDGFPTPTLTETGSLPSGVTFKDNANGTATIAGTTQVAGDSAITITAHNGYGADATQTFTLTVTKATTATTVVSSLNPSFSGQAVMFTATVVPATSTVPTGTVQFLDGVANLGSAVTLTSGVGGYTAQLQTSTLSVGTHSISAIYSGDANFLTSTSAAISQLVKSAITTTSISAPTITYGADGVVTVTVAAQDTAAGTPAGDVTLKVDGGTAVSQTLVNGSAAFTISNPGAGDHTLYANFAAQNNFLASYATSSLHVNQASSSTVITCPASVIYDGTAQTPCTASVTGVGGLSQAVTVSYTNSTDAGTANATAAYAGDANHNGSHDAKTFTINKASSTTSITCPASVTFDGTPQTPCSALLTGAGSLSQAVTVSYTNNTYAGTANATAAYAGDANHNASSDAKTFTINKASSTTSITCPASVNFDGTSQTPCTAAATGEGMASQTVAVTYTNNIYAGTATANAVFAGDANHNGSNDTKTFVINKANSSTLITCPAIVTYNGMAQTPCSVAVTGIGGLSLSPIPTYTNNVNAGTATVSYTFAGDTNHNGSNDTKMYTIAQAPLTITAGSGSMIYGGPVFPVTPSYMGFVNAEGQGSLATQPTCGTAAANTLSPVGIYISSCLGAVAANYAITPINGVVTITPASSTTIVTSSLNPSNWGQVVIFTASVTPQLSGAPTGSVSFYNAPSGATCQSLAAANAAALDVEPLATVGSSQQVSTSTAWLPVGTDTVLACYSGDTNFIGGSGTVSQTVIAAPIAKLDPASLSFGNQQGGTISGPQTVNISNPNGTAPLLISSIKLAGTNPTYFTESDTCSSVAVGASCPITVRFSPPANTTGVATAIVVVTDNDENVSGSTQTSLLAGAGTSSINSVGSLSTYGVFATANGCSSINMSGNAVVDSVNSGANNNSGNVGTNGNANLSGNPVINGAVYSPIGGIGNCSSKSMTGLSVSGKAQAIGGLKPLSGPLTYPAPPAPSPAPPTTSQNISGSCGTVAGCSNGGTKTVYLAPGQYGNVSITGGTTTHFIAGTYNFNSLTLSGNSILLVDSGSGPVVVNLAGKSVTGGNAVLDLTGGVMSNASGQASKLQFYYAGSQPVKLAGNTASYAVVYAPNAPVNLSGGSHFYGAITASTVNNSGGTAIHYDASLPNIPAGDYIWFNSAALNVQGLPTSDSVKIYVTNASISFPSTSGQCTGTYLAGQCTLPVPNAVLTFSPTATTASTTWDAANSRWSTLVPTNGSTSVQSHSFIDGLAYLVPAGGFPAGIQNATWSAAFSTSTQGVKFSWQWGAAIYSSFSNSYPSLGVNPIDNTDPAGTPEIYKSSLVFGATGPGYIGLYTGAAGVVPTIAEASVSPSSLDFTNGGTIAQAVGTTSAPLQAVLTNNMSGSLTISSIQLTGTNVGDFALLTTGANSCLPLSALPVPGSLPTGASCTLYVTFTPGATGKRTAKIVVNDNANNTPQTVFLKGTGQ